MEGIAEAGLASRQRRSAHVEGTMVAEDEELEWELERKAVGCRAVLDGKLEELLLGRLKSQANQLASACRLKNKREGSGLGCAFSQGRAFRRLRGVRVCGSKVRFIMCILPQRPEDVAAMMPRGVPGKACEKMDRIVDRHRRSLAISRSVIMEFLAQNGFELGDVNSKKASWRIFVSYPLHEAVKQNNFAMVSLLLKFGADPRATDHFGRTAYAVAQKRKYRDVLEVFDKPLGSMGRHP